MATKKEKVYRVEFNELQMSLIKQTIEASNYPGIMSDEVSDIREKTTVEKDPPEK